MKWKNNKVAEQTKEKIQLLIKNFDAFILQMHGSQNKEDQRVVKDWKQFKDVIENNPDDIEGHQQYLSKFAENMSRSRQDRVSPLKKTTSQLNLVKSNVQRKKSRQSEIDKQKIRSSFQNFLALVQKNNREILKV